MTKEIQCLIETFEQISTPPPTPQSENASYVPVYSYPEVTILNISRWYPYFLGLPYN